MGKRSVYFPFRRLPGHAPGTKRPTVDESIMKKQEIPWQLMILTAALIGVLLIYQSRDIDNRAILPLLGGACLLMGLISLRTLRRQGKKVPPQIGIQCAMGALILLIGIVETFHFALPQFVWYLLLAAIALAAILFTIMKRKK